MRDERSETRGGRKTIERRAIPALLCCAGIVFGARAATSPGETAESLFAAPSRPPAEVGAVDTDPARPDIGIARPGPEAASTDFVSGRASFSVAFRDLVVPYRVFLLTASPGEHVRIRALPGDDEPALGHARAASALEAGASTDGGFGAHASAGTLYRIDGRTWEWAAPSRPGHHRIEITDERSGETVRLSAAVLVPMSRVERGLVNGYRVGTFPSTPYRGLPQYERPSGLLLLEREHREIPVSPHFTLGQFPAKGPSAWPKYLVLSERLLLKLELLLEQANRAGVPAPTFQVLSGFRSPWYNGGIGRPKYSRHIYGDAADIYVDLDRDGRMDDLNGDGRVDVGDAAVLYDIVEGMDGDDHITHLRGGLGQYPTTSNHGPFIHVDTRLYRARW